MGSERISFTIVSVRGSFGRSEYKFVIARLLMIRYGIVNASADPFALQMPRQLISSIGSDYAEPFILAMSVSAIAAGVSATAIPAPFSASIFPAAVPLPPETIAPA
jgi:hypothetical protein